MDSGSCINAVSKEATQRHGLKTEPSPTPYKVSWINGTSLSITQQCHVPLTMSSYEDVVLCDVLPMRIGSIILGRPWLFDHDAALASRANICLFLFNGQRIRWHPAPTPLPTTVLQRSASRLMSSLITNGCIFQRQLAEEMDYFPICFALTLDVPVETPPPTPDAPEMTGLLAEYGEVFPEELPPMRGI